MGYYIQTPGNKGKADYIHKHYDAIRLAKAPEWEDVPKEFAVICVVDNGPFEAAGFAYSKQELDEFKDVTDPRPKTWLLMDYEKAAKLSGLK